MITLLLLILVSKKLFDDTKDQSIFIAASLIGNTGNLGIPLGIALFGEQSVPYTSIINIANVFFIYTVGIYFYAKDKFSFQQSLKEMIKMPILWFAIFALAFNYNHFEINKQIDKILEMASYATIVIQLIIFGIYLSKIQLKSHNYKLSISSSFVKLILLPIVGYMVVIIFGLDKNIASIFMVSLMVPLAVNNVNIAALYDCKPLDVTAIVFITTVSFLILFYFDTQIIEMLLLKA